MQTLTTKEALLYIQEKTGKVHPYHRQRLIKWRSYGWITRYTIGIEGRPNTYTIEALDALCEKIITRYRRKPKKL